eukprot:6459380-Amphidinium_carterae.1
MVQVSNEQAHDRLETTMQLETAKPLPESHSHEEYTSHGRIASPFSADAASWITIELKFLLYEAHTFWQHDQYIASAAGVESGWLKA